MRLKNIKQHLVEMWGLYAVLLFLFMIIMIAGMVDAEHRREDEAYRETYGPVFNCQECTGCVTELKEKITVCASCGPCRRE